MPTAQDLLNELCESCRPEFDAQFGVDPRPPEEVIAGDRYVTGCCFVRDSIRFLNGGRLIFTPGEARDDKGEYCRTYHVVCRKLTIVGGSDPGNFNPCGPDDPGSDYKSNNVITWLGRLQSAANGPGHAGAAGTGASFDINDWSSSSSNGNNGSDGGTGITGARGNAGGPGRDAPGSITVVALEVEVVGLGSHLTIDWDGQAGGKGGKGQQGGQGGNGMAGREGGTESSWGSESCTRSAGDGGRGGDGGAGGPGGHGGRGGNAGPIYIVSLPALIGGGGALVGGSISYVNDGGSGGAPGKGGPGGPRGTPGKKGPKNSPCDAGDAGEQGSPGADSVVEGNVGGQGNAAAVEYKAIVPHNCSDPIPLPMVPASATPAALCRGFASPADEDVAVLGSNLSQAESVTTTLAGVGATIKPSSTDSQLDLKISMSGSSAVGTGDLVLARSFGAPATLANAITVQRFEVLSIAPNSGARNSTVNVTIAGQCFDTGAAIQSVNIGGAGVTVLNVVVVDSSTVQCALEISNLASLSARSVTVTTGALSHTLLNAFTVTA